LARTMRRASASSSIAGLRTDCDGSAGSDPGLQRVAQYGAGECAVDEDDVGGQEGIHSVGLVLVEPIVPEGRCRRIRQDDSSSGQRVGVPPAPMDRRTTLRRSVRPRPLARRGVAVRAGRRACVVTGHAHWRVGGFEGAPPGGPSIAGTPRHGSLPASRLGSIRCDERRKPCPEPCPQLGNFCPR
jgi:hypothetical protein